jgi:primosomal protein N' (replication factor Y)
MAIARVALDVPVDQLFDYESGPHALQAGDLVVVPFGRRRAVALVFEVAPRSDVPHARLKSVERRLPTGPLPQPALQLIRFCSAYYHHAIGQVAFAALPTAMRRTGYSEPRMQQPFCLTPSGRGLPLDHFPARATAMRALMDALRTAGTLDESAARAITPRAPALMRDWMQRGWVARQGDPAVPVRCSAVAGPDLTDEQQHAVEQISATFGKFSPWLLEGITGSGKTEVYFRLIEKVLQQGRQVLLMVPEINLTPQLEARFATRFPGTSMVALHSGLAEGERCARWLQASSGRAQVVLGTRLSLFTPLPRPGLIVVDEEHDGSFKQQDGVRYSARDLAVFLASLHDVPIVLGSATPSLESYHNARSARFGHVRLTGRPAAEKPRIRIVDLREAPAPHGISQTVLVEIRRRLAQGEQSLVFLNRRGFAPALMCASCGWAAECGRCSARVVWHLADKRLRCHHCGHEDRLPRACPACGNQDLRGLGHGTQRLEQVLAEQFPQARILRVDRDTTRRKQAWSDMRADIHADRADVLVGTQMLAKGHDFPKLTLVAIVNPDAALYSADFRASERLFQQLMQVAGRAGRADRPGEVVVQTRFPTHPVYEALLAQDYAAFAGQLLDERKRTGFPPFVHQAVLRAEAHDGRAVEAFLTRAASLAGGVPDGIVLYDPVPATPARVAGRYRWHLLVQADSRMALQRFLGAWRPRLVQGRSSRVRWALDVDPLDL